MSSILALAVPAEAAGERLDRWLATAVPDVSRSRLAQLVADGAVLVNGRPAKASTKLRGGESVACEIPAAGTGGLVPEDRELRILFEDDDVLVVDKPSGLVMHPGSGQSEGTLVHALLHHVGPSLLGVGGEGRPGIVHRLDKGTTGVVVVAKTPRAYKSIVAQFAARTIEKTYLAIVGGEPDERGRVDAPLGRSPQRRTRMAVVQGGRSALSEWTVVERFGRGAAMLEVRLHTGRTHQARVHLAHAGHGILGDETYRGGSGPAPWARGIASRFPRPALHAWRLALDHPVTGERMTFEAPIPADMAELAGELRARLPPGARSR